MSAGSPKKPCYGNNTTGWLPDREHGGWVVSAVTSHHWFVYQSDFGVGIACSPCVNVGFLWALQFPSFSQKHACLSSKLSLGVGVRVSGV